MRKGNSIIYTESGIPVKLRKTLGFGYIIAAFFFLFNPDIAVIDLLPDAFGYMLICAGLSKLSFVNESFDEAAGKFKKMIFVSLCKFAAILLIFGLFDQRERPYGILLFSFSFLVVDLIYLIPAIKAFFEGLIHLTRKHKSAVAYKTKAARDVIKDKDIDRMPEKQGRRLLAKQERLNKKAARAKSYIEKIYRLSIVFAVVKAIGYALPEFVALTKDEYTDGSFVMYMYENISKYRTLAFIIVLVFGIVWLCRTVAFLIRLCKEEGFMSAIRVEFEEKVLPREGLFIKRAIKNALMMFGLGAILGVDFHVSVTLDNIGNSISLSKITLNIIPDVLAAVMFLSAAIVLKNYISSHKKLVIASSVYMGFSLVASALKVGFLYTFGSYSAVDHVYEAFNLFYTVCASTVLENIAFLVMIFMYAALMKELIQKYTGYIPERPDHTTKGLLDSMHKELMTRVWVTVGLAVLGAVFSPIYDFMLVERHVFAQISWVIDFVIQAAFAVVSVFTLLEISDEVNSRYMLS